MCDPAVTLPHQRKRSAEKICFPAKFEIKTFLCHVSVVSLSAFHAFPSNIIQFLSWLYFKISFPVNIFLTPLKTYNFITSPLYFKCPTGVVTGGWIVTYAHTDTALLFHRNSFRCATSNSSKKLGCASAILSILAEL